jgi:hypothetical protein
MILVYPQQTYLILADITIVNPYFNAHISIRFYVYLRFGQGLSPEEGKKFTACTPFFDVPLQTSDYSFIYDFATKIRLLLSEEIPLIPYDKINSFLWAVVESEFYLSNLSRLND